MQELGNALASYGAGLSGTTAEAAAVTTGSAESGQAAGSAVYALQPLAHAPPATASLPTSTIPTPHQAVTGSAAVEPQALRMAGRAAATTHPPASSGVQHPAAAPSQPEAAAPRLPHVPATEAAHAEPLAAPSATPEPAYVLLVFDGTWQEAREMFVHSRRWLLGPEGGAMRVQLPVLLDQRQQQEQPQHRKPKPHQQQRQKQQRWQGQGQRQQGQQQQHQQQQGNSQFWACDTAQPSSTSEEPSSKHASPSAGADSRECIAEHQPADGNPLASGLFTNGDGCQVSGADIAEDSASGGTTAHMRSNDIASSSSSNTAGGGSATVASLADAINGCSLQDEGASGDCRSCGNNTGNNNNSNSNSNVNGSSVSSSHGSDIINSNGNHSASQPDMGGPCHLLPTMGDGGDGSSFTNSVGSSSDNGPALQPQTGDINCRLRTEPFEGCNSTLEAVARALEVLERSRDVKTALLAPLMLMTQQQVRQFLCSVSL